MVDKTLNFSAPIPGANYTSDTKNYPWHRPPEITNLDDAIELSFKKLTDEDAAPGLLSMIEMGMPISGLTEAFVMSGIGAGKWTPDFALLLAGPVSHIMYLMAKGYGLDPDMGLDKTSRPPSTNFFKAISNDSKAVEEAIENVDIEDIKKNAGPEPSRGGIMAMMSGDLPEESLEGVSPEEDFEEVSEFEGLEGVI